MQNEQKQFNNNAPRPTLDRNQKMAVAFLFFLGFLFIGIWGVQLKNNINKPITFKGDKKIITEDELINSTDEASKQLDTDKDGLNDWEEQNLYKTSAYLDDTDGDGIKDGNEVFGGTSPTCRTGSDCSVISNEAIVDFSTGTTSLTLSVEQQQQLVEITKLLELRNAEVAGEDNVATTDSASLGNNEASKLLSGQIDSATLRSMLVESGMNKADLDKINDADLYKMYQDLLKAQKSNQ